MYINVNIYRNVYVSHWLGGLELIVISYLYSFSWFYNLFRTCGKSHSKGLFAPRPAFPALRLWPCRCSGGAGGEATAGGPGGRAGAASRSGSEPPYLPQSKRAACAPTGPLCTFSHQEPGAFQRSLGTTNGPRRGAAPAAAWAWEPPGRRRRAGPVCPAPPSPGFFRRLKKQEKRNPKATVLFVREPGI